MPAMFTSSTRYATLTQQVARQLEEEIRRGVLRETLPGERQLAARMEVSRRTIRAATAILQARRLVRTTQGAPTRILALPRPAAHRATRGVIGLLLPKPLDVLRPGAAIVEILRGQLHQNGFRLEIHVGSRFRSLRPAAALRQLVTQAGCDGWILASASQACQAWFQAQGLLAVVSGTAHEGVALPSVDVDMFATSRHGATVLLRQGHRRLALLLECADWAGLHRTEAGFMEGIRRFGHGATGEICRHSGEVAGIAQILTRILRAAAPPTALLVVNPHHYLAVSALLAARGMKVPRDLSLLCRDDDVCLRFLPVRPARYASSVQAQAKYLFATLADGLRTGATPARPRLLMPEFIAGDSIAPPP